MNAKPPGSRYQIVGDLAGVAAGVAGIVVETSKVSNVTEGAPHKNAVCTLWPNLNRLSRLVPCGKGDFTFTVKPGTL